MKAIRIFAWIVVGALVLYGIYGNHGSGALDKGWTTDLDKALAEAKKKHQLVMVDFNATWCEPCQEYRREVFPQADFQSAAKNMQLVSIDIDNQPGLAQKYGVEGIPDIRFFSPDGKELGKVVGFDGAIPLLAELSRARSVANL